MTQLLPLMIWFAAISSISGDICDICVCTPNDCEPTNSDSNTECSVDVEEFFICDGAEDNPNETHQRLDLNSLQWPNRNITVSARFNHFKLTYLSK